MEKQHFYTLLNKWPRLRFLDVFLLKPTVFGSTSARFELYVRDRADPPSCLFICHFSTRERPEIIIARYSRWLEEFLRAAVKKGRPRSPGSHIPFIGKRPPFYR